MPGVPVVTVVTMLVCFLFCMRGCGRIARPALPAPSDVSDAQIYRQNSRACAARSRRCVWESTAVIARSEATKQSIFDLAMPSHGLLRFARNDGFNCEFSAV